MDCPKSLPTIDDYKNPTKNYILPDIPAAILTKLGKKNKPVLLKKNIIEKNKLHHPDIVIGEYNRIISTALYRPTEILQPLFKTRPDHFNFIATAWPNNMVVIELSESKLHHEIIGIWKANYKKVKKMRKKTNRDGGQSIITNQQS